MLLRLSIFLLLAVSISTQSATQCCQQGFYLNQDKMLCESGEEEMEMVKMNLCKDSMVVVDDRYTSFSYYEGI